MEWYDLMYVFQRSLWQLHREQIVGETVHLSLLPDFQVWYVLPGPLETTAVTLFQGKVTICDLYLNTFITEFGDMTLGKSLGKKILTLCPVLLKDIMKLSLRSTQSLTTRWPLFFCTQIFNSNLTVCFNPSPIPFPTLPKKRLPEI